MRSIEDSPTVYLFVGRKNEATLCAEFIPVIAQSLETFVPNEIRTFRSLFQYLMELSVSRAFNLVIDEFQESTILMNLFIVICRIFGINIVGSPV